MIMTVKVYDERGVCVSVHEARSDKTGRDAVPDALWRAYSARGERAAARSASR
jgi:hypothetical protein